MPSKTSTDVLILAGGKGTRLRDAVNDRPKPMAEISAEKPFLDLLIDYVAGFGFGRFIICTGYMSGYIEKHYQANPRGHEILVSREEAPLGTGGAVKKAEKLINSSPFLVMNGDSFCPVDLLAFQQFHKEKGAILSMAVIKADETGDYGSIEVDESMRVTGFSEKKGPHEGKYVNTGVYIFERDILSAIPAGTFFSLEYGLFPALTGKPFYAFAVEGNLLDIGTPERLDMARKFFSQGSNRGITT